MIQQGISILMILVSIGLLIYIWILNERLDRAIADAQKKSMRYFKAGLQKSEEEGRKELYGKTIDEQTDYLNDLISG